MTKNEPLQSRYLIFKVLGIGFFLFAAAFCYPVSASEFYIENIHEYSCDTFNEQKDYEINIPSGTDYLAVQNFRVSAGATGIMSVSLPDLAGKEQPTDILYRLPGEPEPFIEIWDLAGLDVGSTTLRFDVASWQNHASTFDLGVYAIDTNGALLIATSSYQFTEFYPNMYPYVVSSTLENLIFAIPYHYPSDFEFTYSKDTIHKEATYCHPSGYYIKQGLYSNPNIPSTSVFNTNHQADTWGYAFQLGFSDVPAPPAEIYPFSYYGIKIDANQKTCFGDQKIRVQQTNDAGFFWDNPSTNIYKSKLLQFATIASTSTCNVSTTMTSGNFFDYYTPNGTISLATSTTPVGANELCMKYWQQGFTDSIFATTTIIVAPATSTLCTMSQLPLKTSWCDPTRVCADEASSTNDFFFGILCGTKLAFCWIFAPTPSALNFINNGFEEIKSVVPFSYYYNLSDSVMAGFATSSFANASTTIGLPMYNKDTQAYYIIPVLSTSSIPNLIGETNAAIFRATQAAFIWAATAILIITILIFTIPLIL
jgi:hypothetical protein